MDLQQIDNKYANENSLKPPSTTKKKLADGGVPNGTYEIKDETVDQDYKSQFDDEVSMRKHNHTTDTNSIRRKVEHVELRQYQTSNNQSDIQHGAEISESIPNKTTNNNKSENIAMRRIEARTESTDSAQLDKYGIVVRKYSFSKSKDGSVQAKVIETNVDDTPTKTLNTTDRKSRTECVANNSTNCTNSDLSHCYSSKSAHASQAIGGRKLSTQQSVAHDMVIEEDSHESNNGKVDEHIEEDEVCA